MRRILGIDFTCAPRWAKPITVASTRYERSQLLVEHCSNLPDWAAFEALLAEPGPWIGGFDFPFGLPSELVRDLGWPTEWRALVTHCAAMSRPDYHARGAADMREDGRRSAELESLLQEKFARWEALETERAKLSGG